MIAVEIVLRFIDPQLGAIWLDHAQRPTEGFIHQVSFDPIARQRIQIAGFCEHFNQRLARSLMVHGAQGTTVECEQSVTNQITPAAADACDPGFKSVLAQHPSPGGRLAFRPVQQCADAQPAWVDVVGALKI